MDAISSVGAGTKAAARDAMWLKRCVLLLIAGCASPDRDTNSALEACDLDTTQACAASALSIDGAASFGDAPALSAGITYEVTTPGLLSFTPTMTGTHTLYFEDEAPHVCDVHILRPTCESAMTSCGGFEHARQYPMVAGEDYELRVTSVSRLRIEAPVSNGPGPTITFLEAPAEGSTTGPRVSFNISIDGLAGDPICRLDGGADSCPLDRPDIDWVQRTRLLPDGEHTYEVRAADASGDVAVATRSWTVRCEAPSAAGALGVLHLDEASGQLAANGVGSAALLGDTAAVEANDPAWSTAGRFGRSLAFVDGDRVTWDAGLGRLATFSIELWLRPDAFGDLIVVGDRQLVLGVIGDSAVNARMAVQIGDEVMSVDGVNFGEWSKLLVSYDGTTLRVFSDNAAYEFTRAVDIAFDAIRLGGNYSGLIDEVWISTEAMPDIPAGWDRYCPLE